jgi:nucleoside-triphosphatase THEP1
MTGAGKPIKINVVEPFLRSCNGKERRIMQQTFVGGGELIIITGQSGAGKSTWCRRLVDDARRRGLLVDGLLSPAVFEAGQKIAIDLAAIGSGTRRQLATRREAGASPLLTGPHTGGWQFDGAALAWGNAVIAGLPPVDVLILDELGPLEILDNQGLTAGLTRIDRRADRLIYAVVRPRLVGAAEERWPWGQVIDLDRGDRP